VAWRWQVDELQKKAAEVPAGEDALPELPEWRAALHTKLDDLAKRIGAVEDFTGDDECQNQLLRRCEK
jgi:hypothetical protein